MPFALKQFIVIFVTALGATAAATVHGLMTWPEMMAQTRGLDPEIAKWVKTPIMMETCIVFFATAYYLGQVLARRIGDFQSAALLKAQASGHMRLLHACGGTLIIVCRYFLRSYYGAPPWQNGLMICFGLFLLVMAIIKSPLSRAKTKSGISRDT